MSLFNVAHAATNASANAVVNTIVPKIVANIILPLVGLAFSIAFVVFTWGVVQFLINSDDPTKRKEGQDHILWGIVGIAIMVSVYGIIRFVAATVGQSSVIGF